LLLFHARRRAPGRVASLEGGEGRPAASCEQKTVFQHSRKEIKPSSLHSNQQAHLSLPSQAIAEGLPKQQSRVDSFSACKDRIGFGLELLSKNQILSFSTFYRQHCTRLYRCLSLTTCNQPSIKRLGAVGSSLGSYGAQHYCHPKVSGSKPEDATD
jgi:hypothetical protein